MSQRPLTPLEIIEASLEDIPDIVGIHFNAEVSRPVNHPDLPTSSELEEYYVSHDFTSVFLRTREHQILHEPHLDMKVAKLGASVVGFSIYNRDTFWLDALYISPEQQCRGIGSALLAQCLKAAGSHNTSLFVVEHTPAVSFYLKHGFTSTEPAPVEQCPQVTPSKRLSLMGMCHTPH